MINVKLNEKLICPYCGKKQEYRAKDYLSQYSTYSFDIQCDNCDELFNIKRVADDEVMVYSNITIFPAEREIREEA